ncbi:LuxR C-terminal-related transcriptional regulator [Labrys sp. KNU-23]|uniref:LuxR C-terminal-related transcriptional regulator n=1 Tax=Labrys sp. KNU-23 TaxID=2789216 RepID=UPI001FEEAE85|nr:LuxR C-terminal-related transcriptional regulator [Labrys sp. KNU-23]
MQPEPILALTPRRRYILRLLDQGLSNKQIALSLGISPFTVRNHIVIIMGALGVTTRARALENVEATGWLNDPAKRDQ